MDEHNEMIDTEAVDESGVKEDVLKFFSENAPGENVDAEMLKAMNAGPQMGVFIPTWVLVIILIGFIGAMGYLVMHILNSQRDYERKVLEKKQAKAERKAAKAAKSNKKVL